MPARRKLILPITPPILVIPPYLSKSFPNNAHAFCKPLVGELGVIENHRGDGAAGSDVVLIRRSSRFVLGERCRALGVGRKIFLKAFVHLVFEGLSRRRVRWRSGGA